MEGMKRGSFFAALALKLLERGGSKAVRLVVQILLARILVPEEFGLLAVILVFISLGDVIVIGGLNSALIQKEDARSIDYSTSFWLSMAFSFAAFLVLILLANPIASFYQEPALVGPLLVLSLQFFPLAFNSIQVAKTTKLLKMGPVFAGSFLSEIIAGIIAIWMACAGFGLWSLVVQQLLGSFIACAITALFVKWHPNLQFSKESAKTLYSFGWKVMGTELLNTGANSLFSLVVGKVYSAEDLGYYTQGQRYPSAVCEVITGALAPVMLADFSNRNAESAESLRLALRKANRITAMVIIPAGTLLFVYADPLVRLLLTEKWLPCVTIMQLFCLTSAMKALCLVERQGLLAAGMSGIPMRIAVLKFLCAMILLACVCYLGCDINFAALAWLLAGVIEQCATVACCRRYLSYSFAEQAVDLFFPLAISIMCGWFAVDVFQVCLPTWFSCAMFIAAYCISMHFTKFYSLRYL